MSTYKDPDALIVHLEKDPLFPLIERYGITNVIKAFPAVDVAPIVYGQWIEIKSNEFPYNNYIGCSVCKKEAKQIIVGGKLYLDKWYDEFDYFKSEYCPYCGAKMDGEQK